MHWPPDQAMRCDVNLIILALDAHLEQVKAIFGSKPDPRGPPKGASRTQWKEWREQHNASHRKRHPTRVSSPRKKKGGAGG